MKSLNDEFFNSKKINNPRSIFGGFGFTCVYTRKDGHVLHDKDKSDPDPVPDN